MKVCFSQGCLKVSSCTVLREWHETGEFREKVKIRVFRLIRAIRDEKSLALEKTAVGMTSGGIPFGNPM